MDKETEKCQQQLQKLRKLPENCRCANCQCTATPYVCLDFGTFVCSRCAGLHRDFSHRIKSVTGSHFKLDEVAKVLGNVNDTVLFLSFNFQTSLPGADNKFTEDAREFIRQKYVERRWCTPIKLGMNVVDADNNQNIKVSKLTTINPPKELMLKNDTTKIEAKQAKDMLDDLLDFQPQKKNTVAKIENNEKPKPVDENSWKPGMKFIPAGGCYLDPQTGRYVTNLGRWVQDETKKESPTKIEVKADLDGLFGQVPKIDKKPQIQKVVPPHVDLLDF